VSLFQLKRYEDVLRDLDLYHKLAGGGKNDLWRFYRAYSLAQTGQHAPAMEEVDALAAGPSRTAQDTCNLARICSLCSSAARRDAQLAKAEQDQRAEQCAARAVELLKKAKAAGFFEAAAHIEAMRKDKDLDPLRERPDYQELFPVVRPENQPKGIPKGD